MIGFDAVFYDDTKRGRKIKREDYLPEGITPIVDQGKEFISGYSNDIEGVYDNVPAIVFGDHTRIIKYVDVPFYLGADGVKVLKAKDHNANYKYLYYQLKAYKIPNTGYNRHFKFLKEALFVEHNLLEQGIIVNKLDKIVSIIKKRRSQLEELDDLTKSRFLEMFGDPEENQKKWNKCTLSSVILVANNGMARRGNDVDGNIVMRLVELQDGYIDYSNPNRIMLSEVEKKRYLLKDKDFLFARVNGNPANVGRCAVFIDIGEPVYHNDHIIRVHFNECEINGTFASALFNSEYGKRQLKNQIKTSAGQYTVSQEGIGAIVTILPPLELQNEFADFVTKVDKSR